MTLKQQVEHILRDKPHTRNSDITLTIWVWKTYYPWLLAGDSISFQNLYQVPSQDACKRLRAKFNSEGKYLPTDPAVIEQRKLKQAEWQEEMCSSNPSRG